MLSNLASTWHEWNRLHFELHLSPINLNKRLAPNFVTDMSLTVFVQSHIPQIVATAGLIAYALKRNKLTVDGIVAGISVAVGHMVHPWPAFFWLLILFFLFGTVVTKVSRTEPSHAW